MGGTRCSGIVSSAVDVLWMSVVRRMRVVGGVCVWPGRRERRGGEWMRGLGLGFTNFVGTGGDITRMAGLSKTVNRAPIAGSGRFRHNLHSS